jgi:hypothetical protein
MMDEAQANLMKLIWPLIGQWQGNGVAAYPTIPTFEYREKLVFTANQFQPFLRYEQRTWKKLETGDYAPSHWEVGFWRLLPSTEIEILNAQGGGRVEVLRGTFEPRDDGFIMDFRSLLVANDMRMDRTTRQFVLQSSKLQYTMQMSTAKIPDLTSHVSANLAKIGILE